MISTLNVRSQWHNSCEDSIFVNQTDKFIYGGVFDGCSDAIKSHWASQTFSYVFSMYENPIRDAVIRDAMSRIKNIGILAKLTNKSFECTCLLFEYNKETLEFCIRVFGDGCYFINGQKFVIDQDNKPDYIGSHIYASGSVLADFLKKYSEIIYYNVTDFKVCSDGIFSFNIPQFGTEPEIKDPMQLLLTPPQSENYLQRMWNRIKRDGHIINDDLSIISYHQDNKID